jgi:hypothetical protein
MHRLVDWAVIGFKHPADLRIAAYWLAPDVLLPPRIVPSSRAKLPAETVLRRGWSHSDVTLAQVSQKL